MTRPEAQPLSPAEWDQVERFGFDQPEVADHVGAMRRLMAVVVVMFVGTVAGFVWLGIWLVSVLGAL